MPTYISLINFTDQGIRTVKDALKRREAAKKLAKDLGGELKEVYFTLGQHDLVAIAEAPNDEIGAKFVLTLGSAGNVRTNTLKAFPEAEYRKIIQGLP